MLHAFYPTYGSTSVQALIDTQEASLLALIQAEDPTRGYFLQAAKDNFPERWAELAKEWKKTDKIKLDDELASAPQDLEG